jgi:hypothetical protein
VFVSVPAGLLNPVRSYSIFHLAAVVSSHAESDYDLGMKVRELPPQDLTGGRILPQHLAASDRLCPDLLELVLKPILEKSLIFETQVMVTPVLDGISNCPALALHQYGWLQSSLAGF